MATKPPKITRLPRNTASESDKESHQIGRLTLEDKHQSEAKKEGKKISSQCMTPVSSSNGEDQFCVRYEIEQHILGTKATLLDVQFHVNDKLRIGLYNRRADLQRNCNSRWA